MAVQNQIRQSEYNITWQEQTAVYQSPNRANDFRVYYTSAGIRIIPRTPASPDWELGLTLLGYRYANNQQPLPAVTPSVYENTSGYRRGRLFEQYTNNNLGLEQKFIINVPPNQVFANPNAEINFDIQISGGLTAVITDNGQAVQFSTQDGTPVLRYVTLSALDETAASLPSQLSLITTDKQTVLRLNINTAAAVFPISLKYRLNSPTAAAAPQRLSDTANWTVESGQGGAEYGYAVSTAGDVNGDGYDDILVGAWKYDNGETDEGQVFAYYGSATGPSINFDWIAQSNQANAWLGHSLGTAGDINGDGYADIIIGADMYENPLDIQLNEGAAFVYLGSAVGLGSDGDPTNADWFAESNQAGAQFGISARSAGDVNGDGFSDVIIGAYNYTNSEFEEGVAFLYFGSITGLGVDGNPGNADWSDESNFANTKMGHSVGTAGDVNGDGYGDIIVGAYLYDGLGTNDGRVYAYYGSPSGPSAAADLIIDSGQGGAQFGIQVSTAGDVNGDGYSDIIVGAIGYDNGEADEGRVFVFRGSPTGLSATAAWTAESNQAGAQFGWAVGTAGDVNGDGYADVAIGAPFYNGSLSGEGAAFVYQGSAAGLGASGTPINADWKVEGNQADAQMGATVGIGFAGDVNGDGFADVLVGARFYESEFGPTNEGQASLYYGDASGLSTTAGWTAESGQDNAQLSLAVAAAGDINGDGYGDVIVGAPLYDGGTADEGAAFVYQGSAAGLSAAADWTAESNQGSAAFGQSVASAGDVNGDGYSDVIIGAPAYTNVEAGEGGAFLFEGSAAGLGASGTPGNADWTAESDLANASLGTAVASAGDVNGDGYADVVIGAPGYANSQTGEGAAYLYLGSASGLSAAQDWLVESDQIDANLGQSVNTAGDTNGDGYDDVIVGIPLYDNIEADEGAAFVYQGFAAGLNSTAAWTAESNQANATFGQSVAAAGDVNGDGYADIIIGAPVYTNGESGEGGAFVYQGSASGLSATAAWTTESNQANASLGTAVATAGDVNGDGYDDVVVGSPDYTNSEAGEGAAFAFQGSSTGLSTSADWTAESNQAGAAFGQSVASAGDINGDGYADVIIGAPLYTNGNTNEGSAFVYYGNEGDGLDLIPQPRRADDTAPIRPGGQAISPTEVRLSLLGRTPFGRTQVKLEWEIKPLGAAFDGTGLGQSLAWSDTLTTGVSLNELAAGLTFETRYRWRARLLAQPLNAADADYITYRSRWFNGDDFFTALSGQQTVAGVGQTMLLSQTAYISVTTQGSLTGLTLRGYPNTAHPQENFNGGGNATLDRYFSLTPNGGAGGYDLSLCLNYDDAEVTAAGVTESALRLCRWSGSGWACSPRSPDSSTASNLVCADGVNTLSDWVIGEVGPTAVNISTLQAGQPSGQRPSSSLLVLLSILAGFTFFSVWRKRLHAIKTVRH